MIAFRPLYDFQLYQLYESIRMMRPPGNKALANETSTFGLAGSFPHYKHIMMPPDQKAKLLAMHRASRANAGIYVAIVLGVYLILLTMLLCRYAKRHRPSTDAASLLTVPPGIPPPTPERSHGFFSCGRCYFTCHFAPAGRTIQRIYKNVFCCCCNCKKSSPATITMDDSIHEIADYPMTSLTSRIEYKDRHRNKNKPVPV